MSYLRAMGGGLEASREGSGGDEPLAGAEVVLERELHGVVLSGPRRRRVLGSAAGGGDRRGRRRGGGGGAGAEALELLVVVEEELVGPEGGGGEGEGEQEEGCEGEETAEEDGEAWSGLGERSERFLTDTWTSAG